FIFYEELEQVATRPPKLTQKIPKEKRAVFQLLIESVIALMRENKDILYSSMVKQTMKRKRPAFNEARYGYRAFSEMLEDAQKHGLIVLREDSRSGAYVVSGFGNSSR
ncbi:OST-HTH/LOTUS domain-containing protein, partial [Acidobacteria bacterium AH-259-D05]|nr:OST-HTH/LOTUS domain-containing protein [Acidobacteria bacterium AH-259-D05]